jgi:hypothetical protein
MVPRVGLDAWEKESLTRVGNRTTIPRRPGPSLGTLPTIPSLPERSKNKLHNSKKAIRGIETIYMVTSIFSLCTTWKGATTFLPGTQYGGWELNGQYHRPRRSGEE